MLNYALTRSLRRHLLSNYYVTIHDQKFCPVDSLMKIDVAGSGIYRLIRPLRLILAIIHMTESSTI